MQLIRPWSQSSSGLRSDVLHARCVFAGTRLWVYATIEKPYGVLEVHETLVMCPFQISTYSIPVLAFWQRMGGSCFHSCTEDSAGALDRPLLLRAQH